MTKQQAPSPIFILGPAHSGKSESVLRFFAVNEPVTLLGTGSAQDELTAGRIAQLQNLRPTSWKSLDVGAGLVAAISHLPKGTPLVIDSLSQWLGEILVGGMAKYDHSQMGNHCDHECGLLIDSLTALNSKRLVLISTEMGCSPPPQRDWTRLYRMKVGELNQQAAHLSQSAFVTTAGILTQIK